MQPWEYLPNPWRDALSELPGHRQASLEEIRFRINRPVYLYGDDWMDALRSPQIPPALGWSDLSRIVRTLVDHSLYARVDELRQGYITLPGGHRVGLAGRAVVSHGSVETVRDIVGINVRVAREVSGAAEALFERLNQRNLALGSLLLVSPPRGGKTTLLRDIIRHLSTAGHRVVVIDERSEVAGFGGAGVFGYDLGPHTDVLDGWPKVLGMEVALRTLGPDWIAVDELGPPSDLQVLKRARYSGVEVVATVHAKSLEDLRRRHDYRELLESHAFHAVVVLDRQPKPGTITDIWSWSSC